MHKGGVGVRMTMITFSKSYCSNDDVILSNNDVNIRAPKPPFVQLCIELSLLLLEMDLSPYFCPGALN